MHNLAPKSVAHNVKFIYEYCFVLFMRFDLGKTYEKRPIRTHHFLKTFEITYGKYKFVK